MTLTDFRKCVANRLTVLFPNDSGVGYDLPRTSDQRAGSSLSLALTYDLGMGGDRNRSRVIWGAPKMIRQLAAVCSGIAKPIEKVFKSRQFLFDLTVTKGWQLLLACESKVYPQHGVGHGEDAEADGYAWDFRKLLLAPAARLLFVARVSGNKQGKPSRSIDGLQKSLGTCLSEMPIPAGRSLYVLIMPGGQTQVMDAVIGIGQAGTLTWEQLVPSPVGGGVCDRS